MVGILMGDNRFDMWFLVNSRYLQTYILGMQDGTCWKHPWPYHLSLLCYIAFLEPFQSKNYFSASVRSVFRDSQEDGKQVNQQPLHHPALTVPVGTCPPATSPLLWCLCWWRICPHWVPGWSSLWKGDHEPLSRTFLCPGVSHSWPNITTKEHYFDREVPLSLFYGIFKPTSLLHHSCWPWNSRCSGVSPFRPV